MHPEEGGLMFKGKISALLAFQVRYVGVTLGQNLTIKSAEFSLFLDSWGKTNLNISIWLELKIGVHLKPVVLLNRALGLAYLC